MAEDKNKIAEALWQDCLATFKKKFTKTVYDTWFAPIKFKSYDSETKKLYLKAPSLYYADYIKENYGQDFYNTIQKSYGKGIDIKLLANVVSNKQSNIPEIIKVNLRPDEVLQKKGKEVWDTQLNAAHTFDNFIEGKTNRVAREVGLEIAKKVSKSTFNPFFVYGGSGIGKSHLANAIGNAVVQLHPKLRVLFVSANEFMSQYQTASINKHITDFLAFYESVDVLIIDDIQFLRGERTQETFFHLFNSMHQQGKNIIFTADKAPSELEGIEERLLTRFKWGLTTPIYRPDKELRYNIIKYKLKENDIKLPNDVIEYIVDNIRNSVRDLEGVLVSLLAHATMTDNVIDLAFAKKIIGQVIKLEPQKISEDDIIRAACNYYHVDFQAVQSKARDKEITLVRHIIIYLLKKHTEKSLQEIGNLLGNRSHSTVKYALNEITKDLQTQVGIQKAVKNIEQQFSEKSFLRNPV